MAQTLFDQDLFSSQPSMISNSDSDSIRSNTASTKKPPASLFDEPQEPETAFGKEARLDEEKESEGLRTSSGQKQTLTPLAERMRPKKLEEVVGQEKLLARGSLLSGLIEKDALISMIFWGPPGVGKTTLARLIAKSTRSHFISLSATKSGVKEIRAIMDQAEALAEHNERTVLFIDEIHRFNKAQQDAFLPYVEKGSIVLIGATTENPSFEVNNALLSRTKVFVLEPLQAENILILLKRALKEDPYIKELSVKIEEDLLTLLAQAAHGDARYALNALEMAIFQGEQSLEGICITQETIASVLSKASLYYDKKGDFHYDLISALHKSMRNSDVQACLYWLARMLEGGEDPLYIARRIVRMASEDIGMADSRALEIAIAAYQACQFLGMPECNVHLAHAITYLALAPKSNAMEKAYFAARDDALATMEQPVPLHLRNAPTGLMKELGYGKEYEYSHNYVDHMTDMTCLPKALQDHVYYRPGHLGSEVKVAKRMEQIEQIKVSVKARKEAGVNIEIENPQQAK